MSDLTRFLRARLDEDEVAARAAQSRHPKPHGSGTLQAVTSLMATRAARALREVEAKQAILAVCQEACQRYQDELDVDGSPKYDDGALAEWRDHWDALEPVLRHLAAVYSDHPDYQQEWKP